MDTGGGGGLVSSRAGVMSTDDQGGLGIGQERLEKRGRENMIADSQCLEELNDFCPVCLLEQSPVRVHKVDVHVGLAGFRVVWMT